MKYYKLKDSAFGYDESWYNTIISYNEDGFSFPGMIIEKYPEDFYEVDKNGKIINFKLGK